MYRKKTLFIVSVCTLTLFFCLLSYLMYSINYYSVSEVKQPVDNLNIIEQEIKLIAANLPNVYKQRLIKTNVFINNFLRNIRTYHVLNNTKKLWHDTDLLFKNNQMFYCNNTNIGNIINVLKSAQIVAVDTYSKGTQLKLILKLEGDHLALFKPQWYPKERVITGNVYAGKDRYGAEILGFYLAAILELQSAPIATERTLNLRQEVVPFASTMLNSTIFTRENKTCIYGKCFYCKMEDPVCSDDNNRINGAIIYHFPGRMQIQRSPWQRTYKNGKKAEWETNTNYCEIIKTKLPEERLLDLIEVAIFDFLIQNGDRHHYETYNNKIMLIDNGKGLGNPFIHHLDILAPLYQCCMLRSSTWNRLSMSAPIATERTLNLRQEVVPFASTMLNSTIFTRENKTCIYGKCFYCKMEDPVCSDDNNRINGAIIYHFPGRMQIQRSPWQRTYKNGKKAEWETNTNYCEIIKTKLPEERLLDLIEVAIFDFLIQNGDRHHYETYNNKIMLIDNGKGLGNPFIHHLDILAPLYQCCMLRSSTWNRLSMLAGGYLQEILKSISDIKRVVTNAHLQAIEDRLLLVYATIDRCKIRNKLFL